MAVRGRGPRKGGVETDPAAGQETVPLQEQPARGPARGFQPGLSLCVSSGQGRPLTLIYRRVQSGFFTIFLTTFSYFLRCLELFGC